MDNLKQRIDAAINVYSDNCNYDELRKELKLICAPNQILCSDNSMILYNLLHLTVNSIEERGNRYEKSYFLIVMNDKFVFIKYNGYLVEYDCGGGKVNSVDEFYQFMKNRDNEELFRYTGNMEHVSNKYLTVLNEIIEPDWLLQRQNLIKSARN